VKRWLLAASAAAMLLTATVVITATPSASEPQKRVMKEHWRFHDGHWSYCTNRQHVVLHRRCELVLL